MNIAGARALVTGGSSGIGLALAEALVGLGARILITGRRVEALERAAVRLGSSAAIVAADVASADGRARTLAEAARVLGGIDILINNAGAVRGGRLEAITEEQIRHMVEVNLTAPILLTRSALPLLRESGEALIVNVSSGIGLVGLPFYSVYAAVKAGIAHFGEALRRELAGEGISVLTVYPTATETPMMATSGMRPPGGRDTAEGVAEAVIDAIGSGAFEVVRGDEARADLVRRNRLDAAAVDIELRPLRETLEQASRNHAAL